MMEYGTQNKSEVFHCLYFFLHFFHFFFFPYDDLLDMIDVKKSQSAGHNDHVILDMPQVNNAFDMPYSPFSDIIPTPDFYDLYTTPKVKEMLFREWLDWSLGL